MVANIKKYSQNYIQTDDMLSVLRMYQFNTKLKLTYYQLLQYTLLNEQIPTFYYTIDQIKIL